MVNSQSLSFHREIQVADQSAWILKNLEVRKTIMLSILIPLLGKQKLKKPNSWVRWLIAAGAIIGSLVLLSLIANQIITGAIALGVVAAVGGIGFVSYKLIKKFDPVVQEKIKNAVITQLIKEAQEKKIETLVRYKQTLEQYLKRDTHQLYKMKALTHLAF